MSRVNLDGKIWPQFSEKQKAISQPGPVTGGSGPSGLHGARVVVRAVATIVMGVEYQGVSWTALAKSDATPPSHALNEWEGSRIRCERKRRRRCALPPKSATRYGKLAIEEKPIQIRG